MNRASHPDSHPSDSLSDNDLPTQNPPNPQGTSDSLLPYIHKRMVLYSSGSPPQIISTAAANIESLIRFNHGPHVNASCVSFPSVEVRDSDDRKVGTQLFVVVHKGVGDVVVVVQATAGPDECVVNGLLEEMKKLGPWDAEKVQE